MNAPDKIYINNYNGGDILINQWHIKPTDNPDIISHAYIRKDALLKWAKKERAVGSDCKSCDGWAYAFSTIIEKLNSM